jgi:hypothetical protein
LYKNELPNWTKYGFYIIITKIKMSQIVSQRVLQRHSVSNAPKVVQVVYSNGRIINAHRHNNGSTTYQTIREGTTVVKQQPQIVVCQSQMMMCQQPRIIQIVSRRVLQRHSISNAPKIEEIVYSNGKIIRFHYHNDGRTTQQTIREGNDK